MKLRAYAKINLTLDVTGRREDGYHTLDTVMQTVSVWDEVEIKKINKPGIRLFCNREYLPVDTKNTAFRAAQYFFERCGITGQGLSIHIRKYIPSRAGMGGGSADAAAVLHGLNQMFHAGLPQQELVELGARVGADVPFCVVGGTCRCRGIGEQVEPVSPLPDCWLVLCKPPAGMSTPRAYALIDQFPLSRAQATEKMVGLLSAGDLRRVAGGLSNRFDETMKLQQVREIKRGDGQLRRLGRQHDRQRLGGVRHLRQRGRRPGLHAAAGGQGPPVPGPPPAPQLGLRPGEVNEKRTNKNSPGISRGCFFMCSLPAVPKTVAVTFAPPAGLFSICSEPPCFSQRERQMYSPRPKCSSPLGGRGTCPPGNRVRRPVSARRAGSLARRPPR